MSRTLSAPGRGSSAALAGVLALALPALAAIGLVARGERRVHDRQMRRRRASPGEGGRSPKTPTWRSTPTSRTATARARRPNVTYAPNGSGAGSQGGDASHPDAAVRSDRRSAHAGTAIALMNAGAIVDRVEPAVTDADSADEQRESPRRPGGGRRRRALVNFPDELRRQPAHRGEYRTVARPTATGDAPRRASGSASPRRSSRKSGPRAARLGSSVPELGRSLPRARADADCEKPIIRVVRFDQSGTTFTFKDYLNSINGGRGWMTT